MVRSPGVDEAQSQHEPQRPSGEPKRGFFNPFATHYAAVNLERIQTAIDAGKLDAGAVVNAETLVASGVVRRPWDGIKILGKGELKAKLSFEVAAASKSAVAAIEKAGGSVTLLRPVATAEA